MGISSLLINDVVRLSMTGCSGNLPIIAMTNVLCSHITVCDILGLPMVLGLNYTDRRNPGEPIILPQEKQASILLRYEVTSTADDSKINKDNITMAD